jgi:hypothetical protein
MSTDSGNINLLVSSLAELAEAMKKSKVAKDMVVRPSAFKGSSENARSFLAQFVNWANCQPTLQEDDEPNHKAWITSFLSFMEGPAAQWALPHLNKIEKHASDRTSEFPFTVNHEVLWSHCVDAFKQRFLPADEKSEAKRLIQNLKQTKGVAEYAAVFQEIAARTGFSDGDLMERFYIGLKDEIKDGLVTIRIIQDPETLEELIKQASMLDQRFKERRGERPQFGNYKAKTTSDPYAMDIDATRTFGRNQTGNGKTREDYQKAMAGRCYGCGSKEHIKAQGNHGGLTCSYCRRKGHSQNVCQDKFMGRKPGGNQGQRVAATQPEKPFTLFPEESSISLSSTTTTNDTANRTQEFNDFLGEKMDQLRAAFEGF